MIWPWAARRQLANLRWRCADLETALIQASIALRGAGAAVAADEAGRVARDRIPEERV
jgi:hypothetical protein